MSALPRHTLTGQVSARSVVVYGDAMDLGTALDLGEDALHVRFIPGIGGRAGEAFRSHTCSGAAASATSAWVRIPAGWPRSHG